MKPSGIGGMAVMEGVMMKNKEEYAVAVRKPNNEIAVEIKVHKDFSEKVRLFKLPIFRGILAFVDSMVVGFQVLNFSASFFEEEEEVTEKKKKKSDKKKEKVETDFEIEDLSASSEPVNMADRKEEIETKKSESKEENTTLLMIAAVMISLVLSVGLFMVLPVLITQLISKIVNNTIVMNLIEGIVRLAIFIGYVMLASLMPEIKRTFMYHGAEHKTINCLENGYELTLENVKRQTKQHKRCGTSFMLLVVLISLVFFMLIPTGNLIWRLLSRVLLVPFIAGISYEFIRLAGKNESNLVNALSKPGLWMQGLTTKEPDDSMIEVAIKSVDAVFDWRTFLADSKKDKKSSLKKQHKTSKQSENEKSDKSSVKGEESQKKGNTLNTGNDTLVKSRVSKEEEEDDEILKALDKFFDHTSEEKVESGK